MGRCCYGDTPSMANALLVPQNFNAQRLKCDLSAMRTLMCINAPLVTLPTFEHAAPANQPDAE